MFKHAAIGNVLISIKRSGMQWQGRAIEEYMDIYSYSYILAVRILCQLRVNQRCMLAEFTWYMSNSDG